MLNLKNEESSYILASADNISALTSYLYSIDYYILDIKGYYDGKFEDSILAFTNLDPDELRQDGLHIMEYFDQDCIIIKYKGQNSVVKLFKDGQEKPMGILLYNTDSNNKSYIHDGLSFSFVEQKLYFFPSKKEDFKVGMIIECFSNNKWNERKVYNIDSEFDKMYKLLMKYNKIRIAVN
jgi:hypothetical protein